LHGDESPAYVDMIKYPVIKAFRVDDGFDFRQLRAYSNHGILLDAYSGAAYGGTGKTFAWQVIPDEIRQSCIIAGGISSKNICEVIEQVNPAGVDLSSSVESEPGKKDPVKVKNFFRQLRSCRISSNYHGDKRKNTDYYGSA
jgi:phosphoribosylanthranilate isomerase